MFDKQFQKPLGRTLKLFLVNGLPTGVITAELGNWNGKVLKAPRSELPNLSKRDECLKTGVYLLIGDDPNDPFRKLVYVGESDKVKDRLTQHDKDDEKEFFRNAYVIIS